VRIFLSHASQDKPFVQAIQACLVPHIRVWLDVEHLYAGNRLSDELRKAILDENDYTIVFVSPNSIASDWVARELAWALEREADLGRPFVVPVFLPGAPVDAAPPGPFAPLWQRIYMVSPVEPAAAAADLSHHLFALLSDWVEQAGDSSRNRFVARLRADLTEFKDRAFLMLAAMGAPIEMLATHSEAHATFARTVDAYVRFSDDFIARKDSLRAQVHSMFGGFVAAETDKALAFVENKVYRGRLFELNAVVDSVNAFEARLQTDPVALQEAEARKADLLAKAHPVLQQMTKRTLALLDMLQVQ
jgi:hypothetical protein